MDNFCFEKALEACNIVTFFYFLNCINKLDLLGEGIFAGIRSGYFSIVSLKY